MCSSSVTCELAFDSSHLMSLNAGVREVKAQGLLLGKMSQHYLVDLGVIGFWVPLQWNPNEKLSGQDSATD